MGSQHQEMLDYYGQAMPQSRISLPYGVARVSLNSLLVALVYRLPCDNFSCRSADPTGVLLDMQLSSLELAPFNAVSDMSRKNLASLNLDQTFCFEG